MPGQLSFMDKMRVASATGSGVTLSAENTRKLYERIEAAERDRVEAQIDVGRIERAVARAWERRAVKWAAVGAGAGFLLGLWIGAVSVLVWVVHG